MRLISSSNVSFLFKHHQRWNSTGATPTNDKSKQLETNKMNDLLPPNGNNDRTSSNNNKEMMEKLKHRQMLKFQAHQAKMKQGRILMTIVGLGAVIGVWSTLYYHEFILKERPDH